MELNILEKKKRRLVFELKGADHTLCNPLKESLLKNKSISVATYSIAHPLISVPKFIIETTDKEPLKVLLESIESLKKEFKSMATLFKKSI